MTRTFVTQVFGVNRAWYAPYGLAGHNGIDFRTKFDDTPKGNRYVRAMAPGVVSQVGDEGNAGYGRFVRIDHPDGSQTVYGHLKEFYVEVGQKVTRTALAQGTILGLSDNTGRSTGSHLHVGYRPPGWANIYSNGFKGYVNFYAMLIL